jgi:hypothetical protein
MRLQPRTHLGTAAAPPEQPEPQASADATAPSKYRDEFVEEIMELLRPS